MESGNVVKKGHSVSFGFFPVKTSFFCGSNCFPACRKKLPTDFLLSTGSFREQRSLLSIVQSTDVCHTYREPTAIRHDNGLRRGERSTRYRSDSLAVQRNTR